MNDTFRKNTFVYTDEYSSNQKAVFRIKVTVKVTRLFTFVL